MTTQPALGSRAEKRAFYARTLRITGPIALQNFMDAAVSSADVIMLSFVSQAALAASSLAGQVAFVLQMLLFGVSSGEIYSVSDTSYPWPSRYIARIPSVRLSAILAFSTPYFKISSKPSR